MEVDSKLRDEWNSKANINNIKFFIRPFNDSTTIVRVQNLHDEKETTVGLYADKTSPFLTTYYAKTITFSSVEELSLGGNMNYGEMLNRKWNWQKVIDLSMENEIFSKTFR